MNHSGIFGPEGFDLAHLQEDAVRFGVVVRLPFRMRVAGLVRVPSVDAVSEVWLFNGVAIPLGSHLPAILHSLPNTERDGYGALWTEAVVILSAPKLVDGALEALRKEDPNLLACGENLFHALTSLNETIFGYSEAVNTVLGGTGLRFLTDSDFFAGLRLQFVLVANAPRLPTEADVKEVIEWRPERTFRSLGQLTGDLFDLPVEALASIPQYVETLRARAYHELAFRAKMAMLDREPVVALVLACAALEGAHADFLHQFLAGRLAAYGKNSEGLVENLLREQGIYTLLQLTSEAFMERPLRPTLEEVRHCLGALTIRNEIVHAKQRKGAYRLRAHTFKDLSDAYQAVFLVFSAYVKAIQQRGDAREG